MDRTFIVALFNNWSEIFSEHVDYLTELDGVAGDADLGLVMNDGFSGVAKLVAETSENDIGKIFYEAGKAFNNIAPSSMGTLLSAGLMNIGRALKGKTVLDDTDLCTILQAAAEGIQNAGQAREGEKTFLDAIFPAARAMKATMDKPLARSIRLALAAAEAGVEKAKGMVARHGRIAFRGDASAGIIDPGSVVALLFVRGLYQTAVK